MACRTTVDDKLDLVALGTVGSGALAGVALTALEKLRDEFRHVLRPARVVLGAQLEPGLSHAQESRSKSQDQTLGSLGSRPSKAGPMLGHDLLERFELTRRRAA